MKRRRTGARTSARRDLPGRLARRTVYVLHYRRPSATRSDPPVHLIRWFEGGSWVGIQRPHDAHEDVLDRAYVIARRLGYSVQAEGE